MNNISDDEKDLYISKKLNNDDLISKKYDDMFNDFLKGDHEMKKEEKIEEETNTKEKKVIKFFKPLTAVAACAVIFIGANVYAHTQGYDNIFFLIKDLRNKEKVTQEVDNKKDLLSDTDTTISYTRMEIADGLTIQIRSFSVTEGKAKLNYSIESLKNSVKPYKFIVSSNGVELANEIVQDERGFYKNSIELNDLYTESMKILDLKVEDSTGNEIVTIKIDLDKKEINLVDDKDTSTEIKKISETDLKEKLGIYAILETPYKLTEDDKSYFIAINLLSRADDGSSYIGKNDFWCFKKDAVNEALSEANLPELSTKVSSNEFYYEKTEDAFRAIDAGDASFDGLVLNIDDLKYSKGQYSVTYTYCFPTDGDYVDGNSIEKLDRYQATLTFTLNGDNAKYTKYRIINIESKAVENKQTEVTEPETSENTDSNEKADKTPEEISKIILDEIKLKRFLTKSRIDIDSNVTYAVANEEENPVYIILVEDNLDKDNRYKYFFAYYNEGKVEYRLGFEHKYLYDLAYNEDLGVIRFEAAYHGGGRTIYSKFENGEYTQLDEYVINYDTDKYYISDKEVSFDEMFYARRSYENIDSFTEFSKVAKTL